MNKNSIFLFLSIPLLCSLLLYACSRDEDSIPNLEADIETATIENGESLLADVRIDNNRVIFTLNHAPADFKFAPVFTLTKGATIEPVSGTLLDFSSAQQYTTHSESGGWEKNYEVIFQVADTVLSFHFEHVVEDKTYHYHEIVDVDNEGNQVLKWDSSNSGYSIVEMILHGSDKNYSPEAYPMVQIPDGVKGKGIKLETKTTSEIGGAFGQPIAAGGMFIGVLDKITQPDARIGIHYGKPYKLNEPPKYFRGYFRYKKGPDFIITKDTTSLTEDTWDGHAVLFEKTDQDNYLRGDYQSDDPRIVAEAQIPADQRIETDEWTYFNIPFTYRPGKTFDPGKEYMYTIILSSSKQGDAGNGAIGSKLLIDEVSLVTK